MRIFSSMTLGILLVLFGILFILKNTLNINIPTTRIIIGVLIIAFGVNVLFGSSFSKGDKDIIFQSGTISLQQGKHEYNVIFGNGVIDFSNVKPGDFKGTIEINVIFGQADLKVNPDIPVTIETNTVFGTTKTPEIETNFFGDSTYKNKVENSESSGLKIETNTVFGQIKIIQDN